MKKSLLLKKKFFNECEELTRSTSREFETIIVPVVIGALGAMTDKLTNII